MPHQSISTRRRLTMMLSGSVIAATFIAAPSGAAGCTGVPVGPGENLVRVVNGKTNTTFCLSKGTYSLGSASVQPGSGTKLIGVPATVTLTGAVTAPTKVQGTGKFIIDYDTHNAANVVLENLDISGARGTKSDPGWTGRGINKGSNVTVRTSRIHDNSGQGVGGADGMLLDGIELDHNGSASFLGGSAGGVKSANPYTIQNSYVHDNTGNGIWQDVAGTGLVVKNNLIASNTRSGVRYEHNRTAPGNATITGNTIKGNNTSHEGGAGGVAINSAPNAQVSNNTFGGNSTGIFIGGNRGPLTGTKVVDNRMGGDTVKGCDGAGVTCSNNK